MSATSLIDCGFAEGEIQNADGQNSGVARNCAHKLVAVTLGG